MKKRNLFVSVAYGCLILVLVLVIIYSGLQLLESTVFLKPQIDVTEPPSKTITENEIAYFPRQDITVVLVCGIDRTGPMVSSDAYNNPGDVDMINLVIFDEKEKELNVLSLNRDTMTEVPVLGIGGREAYTTYEQLALSYSYGSGMEDSCENTVKAVSHLLNGIYIDHYITLNMDAIQILNDAVGGVTVNVTDDFSQVDPTLTPGVHTLHGEQAVHFVRNRKDVGNQLNLSRMERHKAYMQGFLEAMKSATEKSATFALDTYSKVSKYMITDCSSTVFSNMLERYKDYPLGKIISPEGENKIGPDRYGEDHYQFYLDEESMKQIILDLFYAPKDMDN